MIILITHGSTLKGFNPLLSVKGTGQMLELKAELLKKYPDFKNFKVIAGIGQRHKQSAIIMAIMPYPLSEHVGSTTSCSGDGEYVYMSAEEKVPLRDLKEKIQKAILETKNFLLGLLSSDENFLIIGGRITAIAAGVPFEQAKSACIYKIELINGEISIKEIFSVD